MKKPGTGFFLRLSALTVSILGVGAILFRFLLAEFYTPAFIPLLGFVFILTQLTFSWLVRTARGKGTRFINAGMIVTMIRLLAFGLITVIYFILYDDKEVSFVVVTGLLYLIYTAFEVSQITAFLKNNPSSAAKINIPETDHHQGL